MDKDFQTILVMGKPGIGKSVHCQHLVYTKKNHQWDILNDKIILVVLLKNVGKEENIYDAIFHQNFEKLKISFIENNNIFIDIIQEKPENFILFIDGVDEYSFDDKSIQEIIEGRKSIFKTVLWSRDSAIEKWLTNYDFVFELIGLTGDQLEEFLREYVNKNDKLDEFITEIKVNKNEPLQKLCEIPLLALIVYFVWIKKGAYLRNCSSYYYYNEFIETFQKESGFDKDLNQNQKIFYQIKRLSFKNINENSITVSYKQGEDFEKTNCLKGFTEFVYQKKTCIIQFFHLSIQEFLAAQYFIEYSSNYFCCRRSIDNDMISKTHVDRLISIFQFVFEYNYLLFRRFSRDSSYLNSIFLLSHNVKKQLNNIDNLNYVLTVENEIIQDNSLFNFCKKIKEIQELILFNVDVSFLILIKTLLEVSPRNIKHLYYKPTGRNSISKEINFYTVGFTKLFFRLINESPLLTLQINTAVYIIRRSGKNLNNIFENISLWDDNSDLINCRVNYGKNRLISFRDSCSKNFRKFGNNFLANDELRHVSDIVLENKIFDGKDTQNVIERLTDERQVFVKKYSKSNFTKTIVQQLQLYRKFWNTIYIVSWDFRANYLFRFE